MYDYIIVGGGILGLSVGRSLYARFPDAKVAVIEKESEAALHQTGRNSGVIHSGIYYKPGSFKARFAAAGNRSMIAFCQENDIKHEVCGKVIVATKQEELHQLDALYERGLANKLVVEKIGSEQLMELEPHVNGLAAIHVRSAGIVNYKQVCNRLIEIIESQGGEVLFQQNVRSIKETADRVTVLTSQGEFEAKMLINCAGLHSDRMARNAKMKLDMKIVPFKGEYYELKPERRSLVKNLIYPVPNPSFPFLGVHFTRMIDGHVEAGPNAILSLKREGYGKTEINLKDLSEVMLYPGFWKLAVKYWKEGMEEMHRSFSKKAFVKSLQQLIPEITADDLQVAPSGIRAQALRKNGELVDDFYIATGY